MRIFEKPGRRKGLLIALGVLTLTFAALFEQGFKGAGYYATVLGCAYFNAVFLANPLGFLRRRASLACLAGMVIANYLLLGVFVAPVIFFLVLWLPAIAGVLIGHLVRKDVSR
jgi:hypothetical protein